MLDPTPIFKAYDVRGLVPEQFDTQLSQAMGGAWARLVQQKEPATTTVIVGRDMRPSGPELVAAFTEGVTAQGLNVIDIGLCSTDMMYFASGHLNLPGTVFTASHNPAGYNGIKFCLSAARPVALDTGLDQVRDQIQSGVPVGPGGGEVTHQDLLAAFADHVCSFVDLPSLRPLKVIADTANGMGGLVVPAVFAHLPFELEVLYPELDGTFPNHPADPIQPENLVALQQRVRETGADVGLAFDGDADRVFLIDEKAQPISGSLTTALVAQNMLSQEPAAAIVHNLICSKVVPEVIAQGGGRAVRTRVGHSYIKAIMAEENAIFGGEHSGHYYFRDNFFADSGIIAALIILQQLAHTDQPLSALVAPFERYAASGEINTQVENTTEVIDRVAAHYADHPQDRMDGLTVQLADWWFNLRPSNTEPLLRLNLEANTPALCQQGIDEVRQLFTNPQP